MAKTKSQIAIDYNRRQDAIMIRPSKERGAMIRATAAAEGKPVQQFIWDCCVEHGLIEKTTENEEK